MVMALGTNVDVGIVLVEEHTRSRDEIIFGGGQRIVELMRIRSLAVRFVAVDTLNAQVGIPNRQGPALDQAEARRPGMTSAAAVDAVGWIHVLDHARMRARFPFLEGRLMRAGMAAAADLRCYFEPWPHCGVVWISGVIGGWPVAILALDPFKLRSDRSTDEPGWDSIADGVTGQAAGVGFLVNLF